MQTFDTKLGAEFVKLATTDIASIRDDIAMGNLSHDDYKYQCGRLAGLRASLDLLDEAQSNIQKD